MKGFAIWAGQMPNTFNSAGHYYGMTDTGLKAASRKEAGRLIQALLRDQNKFVFELKPIELPDEPED